MVGIVLVSHSAKVAEGIEELAWEMVPRKIPLVCIGGDEDGRMGTNIDEIIEAVEKVYSKEGVIIIGDVGSSLANSKEALAILELEGYDNLAVSNAPLVEGGIIAAVEANLGKSLSQIKQKVESKRIIDWI